MAQKSNQIDEIFLKVKEMRFPEEEKGINFYRQCAIDGLQNEIRLFQGLTFKTKDQKKINHFNAKRKEVIEFLTNADNKPGAKKWRKLLKMLKIENPKTIKFTTRHYHGAILIEEKKHWWT